MIIEKTEPYQNWRWKVWGNLHTITLHCTVSATSFASSSNHLSFWNFLRSSKILSLALCTSSFKPSMVIFPLCLSMDISISHCSGTSYNRSNCERRKRVESFEVQFLSLECTSKNTYLYISKKWNLLYTQWNETVCFILFRTWISNFIYIIHTTCYTYGISDVILPCYQETLSEKGGKFVPTRYV